MENLSSIALIGVVCTVGGMILNYTGFFRGAMKDNTQGGRETGELKANTDYIRRRIDDMLLEQRETNKTITSHGERLTRVEESVKQAHLRLDRLET